jgi:regulator of protease activity HflC (stomatin/prohibitin superfamily)
MPFLAFLFSPAGRLVAVLGVIALLAGTNVLTFKAWRHEVDAVAKAKAELAVASADAKACSEATQKLVKQAEANAKRAAEAVKTARAATITAERRVHEILESMPDQANLCNAALDLSREEIRRRRR